MPSDRATSRVDQTSRAAMLGRMSFWLTTLLVTAGLVAGKMLMHISAHTEDLDTGNYSNYAWGILHGQGFYGSVLGRHHLGEHFSPIMALVAPLYLLRPTAHHLMILQGLAVAIGVLLTLVFSSRRLEEAGFDERLIGPRAVTVKAGAAGLLLLLMMLYPPLLATWNTQFQPIELGLPMVVGAMMLLHAAPTRRNALLLWLLVILLLSTRESAPLSVLGLAIYAASLRRARLALALGAVAGVWAAIAMGIVMPWFRGGEAWGHIRWLGLSESTDSEAFMWERKAFYLAALVGGMGLLPLMGRRALWATAAALPGVLLNLSVKNRVPQVAFQAHYDAQISGFLIVAAALGAAWLAQRLFPVPQHAGSPTPRHRPWAAVAFMTGMLAISFATFQISKVRSVPERFSDWWPTHAQQRLINQSKEFARKYSDAPSLAAHGWIGPHVAHRPDYRSMRVTDKERWPGWVRDRVDPGMIFIVPGERYAPEDSPRAILRASGRAQLLEQTPWVEVYRWPGEAPPRGTDAAEQYAREGLERAVK